MANKTIPNYPDILGYITQNQSFNAGVVQCALALRPGIVPAGKSFEAVVLLQNTSDINVEVTATLQLPDKDAAKKPGRFVHQVDRLIVSLRPAEVGYITLPVTCLPDTTVSSSYKIGMEVRAQTIGRPRTIRQPGHKTEVNLDYYFFLSEESIARIVELKGLAFTTTGRGLRSAVIEAPLNVTGGKIGQLVNLKPGWISLWALGEHTDVRPLLERHREVMLNRVLPKLKGPALFKLFYASTEKRLSHYPLEPVELYFITRLLTATVAMASGTPMDDYLNDAYFVGNVLQSPLPEDGSPVLLPHWCRALLHLMSLNEAAIEHPEQALARPLYDDVLRDAIARGFRLVQAITNEALGSESDMQAYGDHLIQMLRRTQAALSFTDLYMPLLLGGILVGERLQLPGEDVWQQLQEIDNLFKKRLSKHNPDQELVFRLTEKVIAYALENYRYL